MKNKYDIKDDELRIIGKPSVQSTPSPDTPGRGPLWIIMAIAAIAIACVMAFFTSRDKDIEEEQGLFEEIPAQEIAATAPQTMKKLGMEIDSLVQGFTEKIDTTINDIPLTIYIPHNATAELCLKTPDINDSSIIFCAQAADIRKDNKKIVGAFVLKGEPLAWGLSKKGYCGIIDGKITVGVADNSPLFEKATEKGGYFFRQYPLVDNGTLVENEPKNKSIRKALCDRNGEIFIAVSNTPESFHDFAQALVDLDVDNAIYLVGGEYAKGWYRNQVGEVIDFSKARRDRYKYENYIVWSKSLVYQTQSN